MEVANIPSDPVVMMLMTKRTTVAEVAEFMLAELDDFSWFSLLFG